MEIGGYDTYINGVETENGLILIGGTVELADDESIILNFPTPIGPPGNYTGAVKISNRDGSNLYWCLFTRTPNGFTPLWLVGPVNNGDVDNNLCLYFSGNDLVLKNRLGAAHRFMYYGYYGIRGN